MPNVFDIIKRITTTKDKWENIPEEERETFNKWIVQKYLSFYPDYVEVVNIIQTQSWQMAPELLYKVYCDIIPKKSLWLKYIKQQNKKEYKEEEIKVIAEYYEISSREAKEYINTLPKEELKDILSQFNLKTNGTK